MHNIAQNCDKNRIELILFKLQKHSDVKCSYIYIILVLCLHTININSNSSIIVFSQMRRINFVNQYKFEQSQRTHTSCTYICVVIQLAINLDMIYCIIRFKQNTQMLISSTTVTLLFAIVIENSMILFNDKVNLFDSCLNLFIINK